MEASAPAHGEALWPMAAAVVAGLVLTMLRPAEVRVAPRPVLPAVPAVELTPGTDRLHCLQPHRRHPSPPGRRS
jgi:hypothetical protein